MIIKDLIDNVTEIPLEIDYWFVRTDYGKYFQTFYENGFIGIGWNNITLEEIKNPTKLETIKDKLFRSQGLDKENPFHKRKVSSTINKLKKFVELDKGDIVIIPSRNSSRYAFGVVESKNVFIDNEKSHRCEFYKRKKVHWIELKRTDDLDPHFYPMRFTRHTITNVNEYSEYIDNVISNLYIKGNNAHFVIDIKTKKDINVNSLITLIDNIQLLTEKINDHYHLNEKIEKNSIRLNLQSPGKIEFKLPSGKSLIILALILSTTCSTDREIPKAIKEDKQLTEFMEIESDTIIKVKEAMIELEADYNKINNF